jgi:hypothetical protein
MCPGIGVGCLNSAGCGAMSYCCLSLIDTSTTCGLAVNCLANAGVILCTDSSECPAFVPNCCRIGGTGICRLQACP